jgi:hypothetical protein
MNGSSSEEASDWVITGNGRSLGRSLTISEARHPASSSTRDCFDSTESLIPAVSRSAANSTQSASAASNPQIDNRGSGE